jgi:hypothetical protein
MSNGLIFFFNKYEAISVSTALKLIAFNVVESEPIKTDFICFSPTIRELTNFTSLITNFGSALPEPNGANKLIFSKKSTLRAVGAISASK